MGRFSGWGVLVFVLFLGFMIESVERFDCYIGGRGGKKILEVGRSFLFYVEVN